MVAFVMPIVAAIGYKMMNAAVREIDYKGAAEWVKEGVVQLAETAGYNPNTHDRCWPSGGYLYCIKSGRDKPMLNKECIYKAFDECDKTFGSTFIPEQQLKPDLCISIHPMSRSNKPMKIIRTNPDLPSFKCNTLLEPEYGYFVCGVQSVRN